MSENKKFSFKYWAKTKATVEEHFKIEVENLLANDTKESD